MKKIITIVILSCLCYHTAFSQIRKKQSQSVDRSSGSVLIAAGIISMSIGVFIPDGSEWTFAKGYNSTIITKPFYKNPSRVACIGIGLTISIGGIYQLSKK